MISTSPLATVDDQESPPPTIDALASVYDFRDPQAVRAFLEANTDLLILLREIPARVAAYLPTDERLVLERIEDPEDEDAQSELFALIPTRLDPEVVLQRLDRLSRDWWLDVYRQTGG